MKRLERISEEWLLYEGKLDPLALLAFGSISLTISLFIIILLRWFT